MDSTRTRPKRALVPNPRYEQEEQKVQVEKVKWIRAGGAKSASAKSERVTKDGVSNKEEAEERSPAVICSVATGKTWPCTVATCVKGCSLQKCVQQHTKDHHSGSVFICEEKECGKSFASLRSEA